MNVLVTGGAGYVGYSVCKSLAEKFPESKIIIYDNLSKGKIENIFVLLNKYKNIHIVPWENADIRDSDKFEKIILEYKPHIVVHLAAIVDAFTTNREGKDLECQIVNNVSAVDVARVSKLNGVNIFIYQSTVSMYSRGDNLTEDSPKEPVSTYGIAKYEAEKSILSMSNDSFKVCAIRSATIVGFNPSFRYETIINLMCIRSVYGMKTTIFESALKNPKSYLSLDDESAGIIFTIDNINKVKGQAYNLSSFNTSLQEVVDLIEYKGLNPLVKVSKEKTINQQVYTINSDSIKKLGFIPKSTLKNVINDTMESLLRKKELNIKI